MALDFVLFDVKPEPVAQTSTAEHLECRLFGCGRKIENMSRGKLERNQMLLIKKRAQV
jgi:hypothetical protein